MLSLARRSLAVATPRAASSKAGKAFFSTRVSPTFSYNPQEEEALEVENLMANLHWAHIKDEMRDIHNLMNEAKTNHSIPRPDKDLEKFVTETIHDVHDMIDTSDATNTPANPDVIYNRIHGLKAVVRKRLYTPEACEKEPAILAAFQEFDTDGNGVIDAQELRQLLKEKRGLSLSDQEVDQMILDADINGDGLINYDEFYVRMTREEPK